ncbi:hypothetical protein Bbelb_283420 [Branchiostoma belcheri]|nr:hypothetical protein Bbelb_283420 [Branchiostoma belcheri]
MAIQGQLCILYAIPTTELQQCTKHFVQQFPSLVFRLVSALTMGWKTPKYNNKDVGLMVDAVQKMFDFYKDLGIDMFKDSSVPRSRPTITTRRTTGGGQGYLPMGTMLPGVTDQDNKPTVELFRLRGAGEVLQDDGDIEDKYVVWLKPPEWRAPRLTDIVLRCQAVLDQNRKDRRLPFSNKERKRKLTEFTDRRPRNGRAAEDYTSRPVHHHLATTTWPRCRCEAAPGPVRRRRAGQSAIAFWEVLLIRNLMDATRGWGRIARCLKMALLFFRAYGHTKVLRDGEVTWEKAMDGTTAIDQLSKDDLVKDLSSRCVLDVHEARTMLAKALQECLEQELHGKAKGQGAEEDEIRQKPNEEFGKEQGRCAPTISVALSPQTTAPATAVVFAGKSEAAEDGDLRKFAAAESCIRAIMLESLGRRTTPSEECCSVCQDEKNAHEGAYMLHPSVFYRAIVDGQTIYSRQYGRERASNNRTVEYEEHPDGRVQLGEVLVFCQVHGEDMAVLKVLTPVNKPIIDAAQGRRWARREASACNLSSSPLRFGTCCALMATIMQSWKVSSPCQTPAKSDKDHHMGTNRDTRSTRMRNHLVADIFSGDMLELLDDVTALLEENRLLRQQLNEARQAAAILNEPSMDTRLASGSKLDYPPKTAKAAGSAPHPDNYFQNRMFLWAPMRMWKISLFCPKCNLQLTHAGLYPKAREMQVALLPMERRHTTTTGPMSQEPVPKNAALDNKCVTLMKPRTLGNSSSYIHQAMEECHSEAWAKKCLQYLSDCEVHMRSAALTGLSTTYAEPPGFRPLPLAQWFETAHPGEIMNHQAEMKGVITSTYGRILKLDSTKKITKKLAGDVENSASWMTNVANEKGSVLNSVLTTGEGPAMLDLCQAIVKRYKEANEPAPEYFYPWNLSVGLDSFHFMINQKAMRQIWNTQQKHIACILDPSECHYTQKTEASQKGGKMLDAYRSGRGSSSLESFHKHQCAFVPGWRANAVHMQMFVLEGTSRWNQNRARESLDLPETSNTRLHDTRLMSKLNALSIKVLDRKLLPEFTHHGTSTGLINSGKGDLGGCNQDGTSVPDINSEEADDCEEDHNVCLPDHMQAPIHEICHGGFCSLTGDLGFCKTGPDPEYQRLTRTQDNGQVEEFKVAKCRLVVTLSEPEAVIRKAPYPVMTLPE